MNKLDPNSIQSVMALTPVQEGMLYHYLKEPDHEAYFNRLILDIRGSLDPGLFQRAWNRVTAANPVLRTLFRWEKMDSPVQVVLKHHEPRVIIEDLSPFSGAGRQVERWETLKSRDREAGFHLGEVPFRITLCRMDADRFQVMISNHHILYDGWSMGIILKQFLDAYHSLSRGQGGEADINVSGKGFKEFVQWSRSGIGAEGREFWQHYLKDFDGQPSLPIKTREPANESSGSNSHYFTLDKETTGNLKSFTRSQRLTLATVFYCAWAILLRKYLRQDDVAFGTTVSGRSAPIEGIEEMTGLFINTIPLRAKTAPHLQVKDFLASINRDLSQRKKFEHTALTDIKLMGREGSRNGEELFETIGVIENYPLDNYFKDTGETLASEISISAYEMEEMPHYGMTWTVAIDEVIRVCFYYDRRSFEALTVQRLARHFSIILELIPNHPETRLDQIQLLSPKEKELILNRFNGEARDYPSGQTIHGLFEDRVTGTPERLALNGMTYHEFNEKAGQLAAKLKERGIGRGAVVAVKMERSPHLLIAIYAALKSGAAYLPIEPDYPPERIEYMLKDTGARAILTQSAAGVDIDIIIDGNGNTGPDELAYIIYTSGSTGRPKGVMVNHGPVVNMLWAMQQRFPLEREDAYLFKTSIMFDVSVTELFGWFWQGGSLVILEQGKEKDPYAIMETVKEQGVSHINFAPSMFGVLLEVLNAPGITGIAQCPSLKYIFLAGEALPSALVEQYRGMSNKVPLINIYGPTEAAVYTSWYPLVDWDGRGTAPIGRPLPNVTIYILDKDSILQPPGVPGELCIAGHGLARGYLNNPELTYKKFLGVQNPFYKKGFGPRRERLYRTGDLAKWREDGNIEFLGRIDRQIKIRGFRVELGEIEAQLESHMGVDRAVATVKTGNTGDPFLCAYLVLNSERLTVKGEREVFVRELKNYLKKRLPVYMAPDVIRVLDRLPVSRSGKVDLNALPDPGWEISPARVPPRDLLEEQLAMVWADVLGLEKNTIGIDGHFFQLGGHSLRATLLISRIHKVLHVRVPLPELFKSPTIRGLANYIRLASDDPFQLIDWTEEREYYPLSPAQERLYVLYRMDPESTGYNVPYMAVLEGPLEAGGLKRTIDALAERHESLRTSFPLIQNQPVQRVHKNVDIPLEEHELESASPEQLKPFIRPFDLSLPPLVRVGLARLEPGKHILMLDMHHIISDLFSHLVFIDDFIQLYAGKSPDPPVFRYRDFASWQAGAEGRAEMKKQEGYWLDIFDTTKAPVPRLNMPIDFPRPRVLCFQGGRERFQVDELLTQAIRDLVGEWGITLNILFLAVYKLLLSIYTRGEDIVVGMPVLGRRHDDLYRIIGFFSNMLPVRTQVSMNQPFSQLVRDVKEHYFKAYENQDYPFDQLVARLDLPRDPGRHPLVETVLTVAPGEFAETQKRAVKELARMAITLTPYELDPDVSHFDLMLHFTERTGHIDGFIEYRTALFKANTIRGIGKNLIEVLEQVVEDKSITPSRIQLTLINLMANNNLIKEEPDEWEM